MTTAEGREFVLRNGFLEQIANGTQAPKGYIGAYELKLPRDVRQIRALDGRMYPINRSDINLADCVYVPFPLPNRMQEFFHTTRRTHLPEILNKSNGGLKPRIMTGRQGWTTDYSDPRFVYLSKKFVPLREVYESILSRLGELPIEDVGSVTLRVVLPESHPVERDHSKLRVVLSERYGVKISDRIIRFLVNMVPRRAYDALYGEYRTAQPIPPNLDYITVHEQVDWDSFRTELIARHLMQKFLSSKKP